MRYWRPDASASSAAQRRGPVPLPLVLAGLGGRGCRVGLHVGALALAPLSIVQAVLSGGLVFLAVLAERYFGFRLGRRQWGGVLITAAGLAVIAVTGGSHTSTLRHYSLAALIAVECGVFALGAGLIRISMRGALGPSAQGLLLGVAAGVLFGVSDIALKYLTEALHGGVRGIISEWTLAAPAASVLSFYASARGLQLGPGVAVIAFTSGAANLPRSSAASSSSASQSAQASSG